MRLPFLEKITLEKTLIYILIFAVLAVFGFIFYLFMGQFAKSIKVTSPIGGEEWGTGQTYKIAWKTRGVSRVGIALFKGQEVKWIAKDVPAGAGSYDWKIYPGQPYGDDYWVAVFEYPWRKGSKIAYSDSAFAIIYPEASSCDIISLQDEWPYMPSDLPQLRKVFVTNEAYSGNLEGFEGADKICQQEAQVFGLEGTWRAFIGGDSEQETAVVRMGATPRKTDGVFVEAGPAAVLLRGATCHRLLGKDFDQFLAKFSESSEVVSEKIKGEFFANFSNIWLGRLDQRSAKNCTSIALVLTDPYRPLAEKYSLTTTCQNWTQDRAFVQGYPVPAGAPKPAFPTCYTPEGRLTDAAVVAGLSMGVSGGSFTPYEGKTCDTRQHLLCIEE